jgi:hypothetical protein
MCSSAAAFRTVAPISERSTGRRRVGVGLCRHHCDARSHISGISEPPSDLQDLCEGPRLRRVLRQQPDDRAKDHNHAKPKQGRGDTGAPVERLEAFRSVTE